MYFIHRSPQEEESEPPSKKRAQTRQKGKGKPLVKPYSSPAPRLTELFGEDSDDGPTPQTSSSAIAPLQSIITNKVSAGVSRQVMPDKTGSHYFELKVYRCSDIEKVSSLNRWRHAVTTIKLKTHTDSLVWQHLANVVSATRKEFRGIPNTFSSFYNMQ